MSRSGSGLTLALGGAALAAGLVRLAYDLEGAVITLVVLAPLGLLAVLATDALAERRLRFGGLRRQALAVGAVVAGLLVGASAGFSALMFLSGHDAVLTAILVAYAGTVGGWAAWRFGRSAMDDLDAVRMTLQAVGEGRRDVATDVRRDDEIGRLAADVDAMVGRLDAEEDARRSLIGAVSHDLRTPITALRLLAEAIDDEIVDATERREYIARMGTHLRALGALIDDLFELSRLDSGELGATMEQVRLDLLVAEAVDAMRPAAEDQGLALRTDVGPVAAHGNPEKLQRVLFNLLQNAIRHTPADGSVTVRASRVDDAVEVEVADTGAGIAAELRGQVFEPFFRGDAARGADGGAGLGLAISRAIVEAHGGRIWAAEAPSGGAAIRFSLPAAAP